MRLALLLLAVPLWAAGGLTTITGTMKWPDATPFTGRIQISLVRPTNALKNTCATPVQVLNFKTVNVKVTNGTVTSFSLYATDCLNPRTLYLAKVFDSMMQLLYIAQWTVPNTGTADITKLDPR